MDDVDDIPRKPTLSFDRKPKAAYKDSGNAYLNPIKSQIRGESSTSDMSPIATRDMVQKHRMAEDVLDLRGEYFPSLQEMEDFVSKDTETSEEVKTRAARMQETYHEQLEKLYDWQVEDYLSDARDLYLSRNDVYDSSAVDQFYDEQRKVDRLSSLSQLSEVNEFGLSHSKAYIPLIKLQTIIASREEADKRRRDAQFPRSLLDYSKLQNKDAKVRIARFLTSDLYTKEKMLSKFGWAWRQVRNLEDEYSLNDEFKTEVQERARELETRDPRRKPN
ncbi:hypothetical protein ABKN59_001710 [Abortiporus biennis]